MNIEPNPKEFARRPNHKDYAGLYTGTNCVAVTATLYSSVKPECIAGPTCVAGKFFATLDKIILGKSFYRKAGPLRVSGYLYAEDWLNHPHMHGVVKMPDSFPKTISVPEFVNDVWKLSYPTGDTLCEELDDPVGWLYYSSKGHMYCAEAAIHALDFWTK